MRDDYLRAFVAAAEAGSFSKAARQLYTTHQTLVRQMAELERELGFSLFERSHQGVTLTPAGREYYEGARRLLSLSEGIEARARRAAAGVTEVRIGSGTWIPALSDAFVRASRDVEDVTARQVPVEHFDARALDEVAEGSFDLLLWLDDDEIGRCGLAFFELGSVVPDVAVPAESPLASRASLGLADLAGVPLAASGSYWLSRVAPDEPGSSASRVEELPCDLRAVHEACVQEGKACLLWPIGGSHDVPGVAMVPLDERCRRTYGLVHRPDAGAELLAFMRATRAHLAG